MQLLLLLRLLQTLLQRRSEEIIQAMSSVLFRSGFEAALRSHLSPYHILPPLISRKSNYSNPNGLVEHKISTVMTSVWYKPLFLI